MIAVAKGKIANLIPDAAIVRSKEQGHTIPITFQPEGSNDLETFLAKVADSQPITDGGPDEGPLIVSISGRHESDMWFSAEYNRKTREGPITIFLFPPGQPAAAA